MAWRDVVCYHQQLRRYIFKIETYLGEKIVHNAVKLHNLHCKDICMRTDFLFNFCSQTYLGNSNAQLKGHVTGWTDVYTFEVPSLCKKFI